MFLVYFSYLLQPFSLSSLYGKAKRYFAVLSQMNQLKIRIPDCHQPSQLGTIAITIEAKAPIYRPDAATQNVLHIALFFCFGLFLFLCEPVHENQHTVLKHTGMTTIGLCRSFVWVLFIHLTALKVVCLCTGEEKFLSSEPLQPTEEVNFK